MNKKNNHPGPPSIFKANQDYLLKFVTEMRDIGMPIYARMVQFQAAMINCIFYNKINAAKKSTLEGFLRRHATTYCRGTMNPKRFKLKHNKCLLISSMLFVPLTIKKPSPKI